MDERSLVGMSNGAKKRAARDWVFSRDSAPWAVTPAQRRSLSIGWGGLLKSHGVENRYAEARKRYRIGERLRACHCDACAVVCISCEGERFEGDICDRCGRVSTARVACDGSGVVRK